MRQTFQWKHCEQEGQKALSVPQRGRKNGQKRKLSSTQEQDIPEKFLWYCDCSQLSDAMIFTERLYENYDCTYCCGRY